MSQQLIERNQILREAVVFGAVSRSTLSIQLPDAVSSIIVDYVVPSEIEDFKKLLGAYRNVLRKLKWLTGYPEEKIYIWQVMDAAEYREELLDYARSLKFWQWYQQEPFKALIKECYYWCWDQIVTQMERNPRITVPADFAEELLDLEDY